MRAYPVSEGTIESLHQNTEDTGKMMDSRNGFSFPRETAGRGFAGNGPGMNRRGTPVGRMRQEDDGGRFLAYDPED